MALRKVEVTVPIEQEYEICRVLQDVCCLRSLVAVNGAGTTIFQFVCRAERLEKILYQLSLRECGVSYGLIVILPVNILRPMPVQPPEDKATTRQRLPIEEVYDRVLEMCSPGFNWFVFMFVAGCVASLGLMFDSTATVVSAMLLSPLMDPLIGMIFGTAIFDKRLFIRGTWYFTIGSLFVLLIGFCFGLIFSPWSDDLDWPTPEMETRANSRALISGTLISFVSGIAAGLCITNGGVNSLVGVAIAASILPPVANGGIFLARGALDSVVNEVESDDDDWFVMAAYTIGLFLINVVNIFIAAWCVFKVKSVVRATTSKGPAFYRDIPEIAMLPQGERPWSNEESDSDEDLRWVGVKRRSRASYHTTSQSTSSTSYDPYTDETHRSRVSRSKYSRDHYNTNTAPNSPSFSQHGTHSATKTDGSDSDNDGSFIDMSSLPFKPVIPEGLLPPVTPPSGQRWLFEEPRLVRRRRPLYDGDDARSSVGMELDIDSDDMRGCESEGGTRILIRERTNDEYRRDLEYPQQQYSRSQEGSCEETPEREDERVRTPLTERRRDD